MPERWERIVKTLNQVDAPSSIQARFEQGPIDAHETPTVGRRITAGVVAFAVFAAAGTFAWLAFDGGQSSTVGEPSDRLPVLSMSFETDGEIADGSENPPRRVNTTLRYGDAREESFTSTSPEDAVVYVDWVSADQVTRFVPGPAVGSGVSISSDGDDPRVLIGSPDDWPNFERWDRIDRLPNAPGDYVLVFEADYSDGIARIARRIQVVDAGVLQLSLIEGGARGAATANAFVDGVGVEGFLSTSTFQVGDMGGQSPPRTPSFDEPPLVLADGTLIMLATQADAASAGLTKSYGQTADRLPLDVTLEPTLSATPASYLLAVDAEWAHGKAGLASDGTRETARFFFQIEITSSEASLPCEPDVAHTWKAKVVPWLSSVLVHVGGPDGTSLTDADITDTRSALQISPEEYEGRLDVYVHVGVPDPEHDPRPSLRLVGSGDGYELYRTVNESGSMTQFTAIGADVWLSLYAYSASPMGSVELGPSANINAWIKAMMEAIRLDPFPC